LTSIVGCISALIDLSPLGYNSPDLLGKPSKAHNEHILSGLPRKLDQRAK